MNTTEVAGNLLFIVVAPALFYGFARLVWGKHYYGRHRVATRVGVLGLVLVSCVAMAPFLFVPALVILLVSPFVFAFMEYHKENSYDPQRS